ncbi:MAG: C25 family cysteine peptidase [Candidatus Thorarchaeota archaeon]
MRSNKEPINGISRISQKIKLFAVSSILITSLLLFSANSYTISPMRDYQPNLQFSQHDIDYLIITSDAFVDDVQPLAIWKLQRGLIPAIKTVEDISMTYDGDDLPERIRNCIQEFHEERNTQWVVLAGGHAVVPTRSVNVGGSHVSCDHYYANLVHNWELNSDGSVSIIDYFNWNADVYVGRLPADNNLQLRELVSHLIAYEKNPPVGPWMTHALFAGAFARFNSDANHNNVFDEADSPEFDANRNHNWLKTDVFPSDWTSTLLGETEGSKTTDYQVDKPLSEANVIEEINDGVSAGMFDSHGSPTGMFRMIFTHDNDSDSLFDYGTDGSSSAPLITTSSSINDSGKYGVYFLCACATGTFASSGDCLSEYILRTAGISCIASSGSAYYDSGWYNGDHGGWYTQGLSSRFWEQFFLKGRNQPGKAFSKAKIDYVEDFISLGGKEERTNKTLIQYNLLGDPEVPVWTMIPSSLEYMLLNETYDVTLRIFSNEQPSKQAMVTLANSTHFYRGLSNVEGIITFPIPSNEFNSMTLTISKNNHLAHQERSEKTPVALPNVLNVSSVTPLAAETTTTEIATTATTTADSRSSTSFESLLVAICLFLYYMIRRRKSRKFMNNISPKGT